ncbi:DUF2971 domain-containing protein, partial [Salmonella enterica]|nr:DUF2971 domain-containing protein [Salmonella enterica]
VTLGCAMQEQDRNKILCMIHNHLPETNIFENKINKRNYSLDHLKV